MALPTVTFNLLLVNDGDGANRTDSPMVFLGASRPKHTAKNFGVSGRVERRTTAN